MGSTLRVSKAEASIRKDDRTMRTLRNAAAIAPFAVWIGLMSVLGDSALAYAARTAATAVTAIAFWRLPLVYGAFRFSYRLRGIPYGILAGVGVAFLWMAPEMEGVVPTGAVEFYRQWFTGVPGIPKPPPGGTPSPYAPAVCGQVLTFVKLFGSAVVIATVEEVFFRSFLYRWLQGRHFSFISGRRFDLSAFALTVFLFASEHDRWFLGAIAGAVYGIVAIKLGLSSAIAAHVTTNLMIGIAVIQSSPFDKWGFW